MTGLPVVAPHLYYYFDKRWHPFITKIIWYWHKWNAPLKLFLFEKRLIRNIIEAFFFFGGGGGGEVCMSLVWISKATVLCIEEEQGQIQDFLMEGGSDTNFYWPPNYTFIYFKLSYVCPKTWEFRKSKSWLASQGFCNLHISLFLGLLTYFHLFIQVLYGMF